MASDASKPDYCLRGLNWPLNALCEKPLKKWHLEFSSLSGDYLTFLCLLLSFLILLVILLVIGNPLILLNTFFSYKILVSLSIFF